jgi:hypothetical protein
MSAPSPIEQSCRYCGYGRRVDGTLVEALPGIVCPGHDLQTHQLQPSMKTLTMPSLFSCHIIVISIFFVSSTYV